jgi:hypothetical protein
VCRVEQPASAFVAQHGLHGVSHACHGARTAAPAARRARPVRRRNAAATRGVERRRRREAASRCSSRCTTVPTWRAVCDTQSNTTAGCGGRPCRRPDRHPRRGRRRRRSPFRRQPAQRRIARRRFVEVTRRHIAGRSWAVNSSQTAGQSIPSMLADGGRRSSVPIAPARSAQLPMRCSQRCARVAATYRGRRRSCRVCRAPAA